MKMHFVALCAIIAPVLGVAADYQPKTYTYTQPSPYSRTDTYRYTDSMTSPRADGYRYTDSMTSPRADSYRYTDSTAPRTYGSYGYSSNLTETPRQYGAYGYSDTRTAPRAYGYSDSATTPDATQNGGMFSSDSMIVKYIQNAVQNANIDVKVNKGVVTLRGTVTSEDVKRRIEQMVSSIPGVKSVDNQLTVGST